MIRYVHNRGKDHVKSSCENKICRIYCSYYCNYIHFRDASQNPAGLITLNNQKRFFRKCEERTLVPSYPIQNDEDCSNYIYSISSYCTEQKSYIYSDTFLKISGRKCKLFTYTITCHMCFTYCSVLASACHFPRR